MTTIKGLEDWQIITLGSAIAALRMHPDVTVDVWMEDGVYTDYIDVGVRGGPMLRLRVDRSDDLPSPNAAKTDLINLLDDLS